MTFLMCICLLSGGLEPTVQWTVSYPPSLALVKSNGTSMLIHRAEAYVYDKNGALLANFDLAMEPTSAFLGPGDSVWLNDGKVMACLNENQGFAWQREMARPPLNPVFFRDYLALVDGEQLLVLDPQDGQARFSLRHGVEVTSLAVLDNWLLISDKTGLTEAWEPITERREPRFKHEERALRFLSRSALGDFALAYSGGELYVHRADFKTRWRRRFYIDIPVRPVWLRSGKNFQLVVATLGRNVLVFGGRRGEQIARTLIPGRPRRLYALSKDQALLISGQSDELVWYHGQTRKFVSEKLASGITLIAENSGWLLMADESGIIRLFQREGSIH